MQLLQNSTTYGHKLTGKKPRLSSNAFYRVTSSTRLEVGHHVARALSHACDGQNFSRIKEEPSLGPPPSMWKFSPFRRSLSHLCGESHRIVAVIANLGIGPTNVPRRTILFCNTRESDCFNCALTFAIA